MCIAPLIRGWECRTYDYAMSYVTRQVLYFIIQPCLPLTTVHFAVTAAAKFLHLTASTVTEVLMSAITAVRNYSGADCASRLRHCVNLIFDRVKSDDGISEETCFWKP